MTTIRPLSIFCPLLGNSRGARRRPEASACLYYSLLSRACQEQFSSLLAWQRGSGESMAQGGRRGNSRTSGTSLPFTTTGAIAVAGRGASHCRGSFQLRYNQSMRQRTSIGAVVGWWLQSASALTPHAQKALALFQPIRRGRCRRAGAGADGWNGAVWLSAELALPFPLTCRTWSLQKSERKVFWCRSDREHRARLGSLSKPPSRFMRSAFCFWLRS